MIPPSVLKLFEAQNTKENFLCFRGQLKATPNCKRIYTVAHGYYTDLQRKKLAS